MSANVTCRSRDGDDMIGGVVATSVVSWLQYRSGAFAPTSERPMMPHRVLPSSSIHAAPSHPEPLARFTGESRAESVVT